MIPARVLLLCLPCLAVLCPRVTGQEVLWQRIGGVGGPFFVGASVFVGDLDGDGWNDLAQNVQEVNPGYGVQGRIAMLSGRTGQVLRWVRFGRVLGCLSPAGDFDGDGFRDYVICGDPVEVRSGLNDRLLRTFTIPEPIGGIVVLGDLDVDGDGRPDILAAMTTATLYAFDNAGSLLYSVPQALRDRIGKVGDVNGDGCDDFVATTYDPAMQIDLVRVRSGRDGRVLVTGRGKPGGEALGSGNTIGCGGDVDGDGVPDFAASNVGVFLPQVARVFSGATGAQLFEFPGVRGIASDEMQAADLDLDGVPDLLVGSSQPVLNSGGRFHWYSLRDGSEVTQIHPPGMPGSKTELGDFVTIGPAQPGSPFPVLATSEGRYGVPTATFPGQGRIVMWRAAPPGTAGVGTACAGTATAPPRFGLRTLGGRAQTGVRLHVSDAPAGGAALFVLGLSSSSWLGQPLPLPLDPFGFTGCSLYTSVEASAAVPTGTVGVAAGYASIDLPLPVGAPPSGVQVFGQVLVLGAGPAVQRGTTTGLTWWH